MTTTQECKSLYKKLYNIMSEIGFIEKDKVNTFHKYAYASEYAIKTRVHEQLVKHGVLFLLETKSVSQNGDLATVEFLYHFVDMETGETLDGSFHGTGEDKNDKAIWKAVTGAIKYILTSTFLIPTGDDPENDEPKPQNKPQVQKPQAVNPESACEKCGSEMKEKKGPRGPFLGCSNYPNCKNTKPLPIQEPVIEYEN